MGGRDGTSGLSEPQGRRMSMRRFLENLEKNSRDGMLDALQNASFDVIHPANFTVNGNAVRSQAADFEVGENKVSVRFINQWEPTQRTSKAKRIHGERKTRLYTIWVDMRSRCSRKSEPSYKNYGERGISVCKEWNDSFLKFKEWATESGYSEDLSIDRIDVNGNYCPENCRWATAKEQANNKRTNLYITINGITHTATEWCEINGIKYSTAMRRRQRGWPLEKAVSFKGDRRKKGGAGNL